MGFLTEELDKTERRLIKDALAKSRRNAEHAAATLGITVDDLVKRTQRLGIPLVTIRRKRKHPRGVVRTPQSSLTKAVRQLERRWMLEALEATKGDAKAAAAAIGMSRSRFYQRLREFEIVVTRAPGTRDVTPPRGRRDVSAAVEKLKTGLIRKALKAADGDLTRAARLLGVSRSTIFRRRKKHGQGPGATR